MNTPVTLKKQRAKYFFRYQACALMPRAAVYAFQDFILERYYRRECTNEADYLLLKGRHYQIYGRFRDALGAYEAAGRAQGSALAKVKALFFQGQVYDEMGRVDEACATWRAWLQRYPGHPWATVVARQLALRTHG